MKTETEYQPDNGAQAPSGPTREEIAALAQRIYEREGCPEGCAEEHWYEAERRLRSEYFEYDERDQLAIA